MERLEKIVVEASEQSGRGNVPTIHQILKLEESIEYFKEARNSKHEARDKSEISSDKRSEDRAEEGFQMLAFHTEGESFQDDILDKKKSIALFIGPEGGWSEKEVELFHKEQHSIEMSRKANFASRDGGGCGAVAVCVCLTQDRPAYSG